MLLPRLDLHDNFVELFPPHLVAGLIAINKLIRIKIIFRDIRVKPPAHKILIKEVEETAVLIVLEHVFRHIPNIQPSRIMLQTEVIAENGQLKERHILVELQSYVFLICFEPVQKIDASYDLLPKTFRGNVGIS